MHFVLISLFPVSTEKSKILLVHFFPIKLRTTTTTTTTTKASAAFRSWPTTGIQKYDLYIWIQSIEIIGCCYVS